MIDRLNDSAQEYEKQQLSISKVLETAEKLVDENFAEVVKKNEEAGGFNYSLELLEQTQKHSASFLLPEREGYQTLSISFWAANPHHQGEPDVIAKILHGEQKQAGDDALIQHGYTIRKTPDGDYVLETSIRDLSDLNRRHREFNQSALSGLSNRQRVDMGIKQSEDGLKSVAEARSAIKEEKKLGLHASTNDDVSMLKKLLEEARQF